MKAKHKSWRIYGNLWPVIAHQPILECSPGAPGFAAFLRLKINLRQYTPCAGGSVGNEKAIERCFWKLWYQNPYPNLSLYTMLNYRGTRGKLQERRGDFDKCSWSFRGKLLYLLKLPVEKAKTLFSFALGYYTTEHTQKHTCTFVYICVPNMHTPTHTMKFSRLWIRLGIRKYSKLEIDLLRLL